ncbi:hypothetical protein [Nocardiopsis sp. RV163]|nr:hypothetical protein [Nocardiopsis sp. RV163]
MLRTWKELDLPDGWRAEGGLFLVAPPTREHAPVVSLIRREM